MIILTTLEYMSMYLQSHPYYSSEMDQKYTDQLEEDACKLIVLI